MDETQNQNRRLAVALRRVHDRLSAGALPQDITAYIDGVFTDLGWPTGGLKENTTTRTPGYGDRGGAKLPMA